MMKRVMIIGGSGSGKSTLSKNLAEKTNLPIVHLDKFFWKPNWELRPKAELNALVSEAILADEWIIDGNNSDSFKARVERADTIIFLDMPRWLRVFRVIKRSDMQDNCHERFDWEYLKFVKFVYDYNENGRLGALNLLKNAPPNVSIFHLTSRLDVDEFLVNCK